MLRDIIGYLVDFLQTIISYLNIVDNLCYWDIITFYYTQLLPCGMDSSQGDKSSLLSSLPFI